MYRNVKDCMVRCNLGVCWRRQLPDTSDWRANQGDALMGLLFINEEDLAQDMKAKSKFSCSSHDAVEFKILQEVSRSNSITALAYRRAYFTLFRDLLAKTPKGSALESRGPQESCFSSRTNSSKHESSGYHLLP